MYHVYGGSVRSGSGFSAVMWFWLLDGTAGGHAIIMAYFGARCCGQVAAFPGAGHRKWPGALYYQRRTGHGWSGLVVDWESAGCVVRKGASEVSSRFPDCVSARRVGTLASLAAKRNSACRASVSFR